MTLERAIVVLHRKGHSPPKAAQIVLDVCKAVAAHGEESPFTQETQPALKR